MALPEYQRTKLESQADEIIMSVEALEVTMEGLIAEKGELEETLRSQIDERLDAINKINHERREQQAAANQLMELAGRQKPYDLPKGKNPDRNNYTVSGSGKMRKRCDVCNEVMFVAPLRKNCPKPDCPGKVEPTKPATQKV